MIDICELLQPLSMLDARLINLSHRFTCTNAATSGERHSELVATPLVPLISLILND
ncbi:hypothetical protein [Desulfopila inferna]|uniref:hypothetical protein n=1 Tax=Desulfopila inferna TaxID=468528 RepID=UPI001966B289|nr:hypothetical protein [Desulfopila inferna]MBM9602828.1 hypothetical protein [Desulfopila inferna]